MYKISIKLKLNSFNSKIILLVTAIIWGLAFVAQRAGMEHISPFAYNGIRFALGSLSLFPLIIWYKKKQPAISKKHVSKNALMKAGLLTGLFLFAGSSFQQIGLVYTTAGNAGFITSLYVILVPIFGIFWKQKVNMQTWAGIILAFTGLYFLSIKEGLSLMLGDGLVLISAFFFAGHVLIIGKYAPKVNVLYLSFIQFIIASILSIIISIIFETTTLQDVRLALIPILYGGILSVGVAYTLQVLGQKNVLPSHAAIILSLESLFAATGGILILHEAITVRIILGGLLMLTGVIFSQTNFLRKREIKS